jgi:hypothetical protein
VEDELKATVGKVFVHPLTKVQYGPIRLQDSPARFSTLDGSLHDVLASDSCGNYFTIAGDGSVWFWDHETDDLVRIANSISDFACHCVVPEAVELTECQVESVWIDPAFAQSLDMKSPKDGWVKKPRDKDHKC